MGERRLRNGYASLPAVPHSGEKSTQTKRGMFRIFILFAWIVTAAPFQPKVFGQAEQGTITGAVRDVSGAMIPGAKINATEIATNAVSSTVSDSNGYYTIPYLAPGTYNVTAE